MIVWQPKATLNPEGYPVCSLQRSLRMIFYSSAAQAEEEYHMAAQVRPVAIDAHCIDLA